MLLSDHGWNATGDSVELQGKDFSVLSLLLQWLTSLFFFSLSLSLTLSLLLIEGAFVRPAFIRPSHWALKAEDEAEIPIVSVSSAVDERQGSVSSIDSVGFSSPLPLSQSVSVLSQESIAESDEFSLAQEHVSTNVEYGANTEDGHDDLNSEDGNHDDDPGDSSGDSSGDTSDDARANEQKRFEQLEQLEQETAFKHFVEAHGFEPFLWLVPGVKTEKEFKKCFKNATMTSIGMFYSRTPWKPSTTLTPLSPFSLLPEDALYEYSPDVDAHGFFASLHAVDALPSGRRSPKYLVH